MKDKVGSRYILLPEISGSERMYVKSIIKAENNIVSVVVNVFQSRKTLNLQFQFLKST